VLGECGFEGCAGAGGGFALHESGGGELSRVDAPSPCPGMGGGDDDDEPVVADDAAVESGSDVGSFDEAEIGLVGEHCLFHLGGVHGLQAHRGLRSRSGEPDQPSGQEVLGDGHAGGHPEVLVLLGAQRGDPGVEDLGGGQHLSGPPRHQHPRRSEGGAP